MRFEQEMLRQEGVKRLPVKSKQKGYVICPECGQSFPDSLRGYEEYADHAQTHPNLLLKGTVEK